VTDIFVDPGRWEWPGRRRPSKTGPAEYRGVDLAPDGRTLTYWRWESPTLPGRIHQLDITTKVDRELRFDSSDYGEAGLVHSPDGSQVLLSRNDRSGATRGQIMIAPADASRPGILIGRRFDPDADQGPASLLAGWQDRLRHLPR
jgi:hypothetical protein